MTLKYGLSQNTGNMSFAVASEIPVTGDSNPLTDQEEATKEEETTKNMFQKESGLQNRSIRYHLFHWKMEDKPSEDVRISRRRGRNKSHCYVSITICKDGQDSRRLSRRGCRRMRESKGKTHVKATL